MRGYALLWGGLIGPFSIAATMAAAQSPRPAPGAAARLDDITISSERGPSTIYNSPATISTMNAREIDRDNIHRPADLVRDEPGVSVGAQQTRTGATNYVIRGIGDNRVRLQIDGVRIPDFPITNFNAGNYSRDFVDFDSLKRVEILRGPSSALYGSDALGGVVSFITKDPSDYLNLINKDWYFSTKMAFDSADRSLAETQTVAGRAGPWEALLLYTRRDGGEIEPNTDRRANPRTYWGDSLLGKIVYNSFELGQARLTGEYLRKVFRTDVLTDLSTTAGARIFSSRGRDETERGRVTLDWTLPLKTLATDEVRAQAYWTAVGRAELTIQERGAPGGAPAPNRHRESDFRYRQSIVGVDVQARADRDLFGGFHRFTYGVTAERSETTRPRRRLERNLVTGAIANAFAGEIFPNKNFPDTTTDQAAVYLQDVAQYGRLRVIPAIRLDYYRLTPRPDQQFANSNLRNFTISGQTEYAISPKLGFTYDLNDALRLFGQYAHGFRAPPYDNANFGFSNPLQGYEILPNGNLKPETSDGFEGGLRGRFADGSGFQVSAFYNRYSDFIDSRVVAITPAGLRQFQFQNLSRVRIRGLEAKGEWRFHPGFSATGAVAWARGEDARTGSPIDSVDPLTVFGGLRYSHAAGWSLEGRFKHVAARNRVSNPAYFRPAAHTTFDILASYEIAPRFTFNAGVYNVGDVKYYNPQDVVGVAAANPNLELFRAPGRAFAANATLRF